MTQFYFGQNSPSKAISKLKRLFKNAPKGSYKIGFIILAAIFLLKNDLSFQFHFNTAKNQSTTSKELESFSILQPISNLFERKKINDNVENQNHSINSDKNLSNDYSNMTYQNEKNVSSLAASGVAKFKKQQNYVKRFAEVARSEMKKFGIPASITLAQGLIESNAGDSRLSRENNNHFGMKCFSKKCKKGHCSNFTDDSHKDFFRKYQTAWESYRAHSIMLGGDRYKHLKKLNKSNYKGWARGLKKAGYATDKRYAEKLIHIIEEMELYQFDD